MKRYLMTSTAWDGEIELEYTDNGLLLSCDLSGTGLTESQHVWFLRKLPRELAELAALCKGRDTVTLTELAETEVTFALFWNRYDEKVRSSKKKAERAWNRLNQSSRIKAYRYIQRYEQSIPPGVAKKYAESYLNAELWDN